MSGLQKVNLGTPPTAVDGDTVRGANTKANANVDVLSTQLPLVSNAATITAAQALTTDHVGKRVNISLAAAGTINLPSASTCPADGVILLRNVGTTVVSLAITTGSGDSVSLSRLATGESALLDTDGVHAWRVLIRGRANTDNETVLGVFTGNGEIRTISSNSYRTVSGNYGTFSRMDGTNFYLMQTASGDQYGSFNAYRPFSWNLATGSVVIDQTGVGCAIGSRPSFAGQTPWDTGNLAPVTTNTAQTIAAAKTFSAALTASFVPSGSIGGCNVNVNGGGGYGNIGLASTNAQGSVIVRCSSTSTFEVVNGLSNGYNPITCSSVTQTSDRDLKTDIEPVRSVLPLLRTKRVVNYRFKLPASDGGGAGDAQIGVIAQEWQEDFPELIEQTGVEIDADGDFIARQFAPIVEVMREEPVLDDEGRDTGETKLVGTGEFTGGQEIFGAGGKPQGRAALGFKYGNSAAVALAGVIEVDATVQALLARIEALEAKVGK